MGCGQAARAVTAVANQAAPRLSFPGAPELKRYLVEVRAAFRLSRLILHFLGGAGMVAFVFPLVAHERRHSLRRRWSSQLLGIFNIRLVLQGVAPARGSLLVANHTSWLDIYGISAVLPAAFVSKAEVRGWPLVGWLAARTDTLFLQRGNRGHVRTINAEIGRVLKAGGNVTVFPEGTTTDGTHMLHFHAALLQPAIEAGHPVQPWALDYRGLDGASNGAAAYAGDTTMWQSLRMISMQPGLILRIDIAPALPTSGIDRRTVAAAAHGAIAKRLGIPSDQAGEQST